MNLLTLPHYPTREAIEAELQREPTEQENAAIAALAAWRESLTHSKPDMEAVKGLVGRMYTSMPHTRPTPSVAFGERYCYSAATHTVILEDGHPSIISTLHETAHALFGSSELTACVFSIRLFKAVYPKAFARLEWDGHMLKRPAPRPNLAPMR